MSVIVGWDVISQSPLSAGDLLAMLAGVFYAGYLLATQRIRTKMDTLPSLWVASATGTVLLLGFILATGQALVGYSLNAYMALLGLGLISQLVGWLAINYALGGLRVGGYHIWNLAVHLLCGALVFACVRRTLEWPRVPDRLRQRSIDLAFAVAILWTLHPLNTEVVDYVTERTESMMALFYLLTIYGSARAIGSSQAGLLWQATAVLSCGMGMACKESMVTAPVMVVLYDRTFVFGSLMQACRRRWRF
jgi:threonine/homoserine efflux transporter RhtA